MVVMFIICQFRTMAEITRYLNMEKIVHLPPNPGIFKDNLKPGQFDDTWLAALECLVDYIKLEGKFEDLGFVIDMIENDPVPRIRHEATRCLVKCPPFERGRHHRNDRPELVENYIICTCQKIHFQNKTEIAIFTRFST